MEVDIFPKLNLPVIYVCQPYGGMDPAQMEGFLTNYYEYHFLYISGIHHVESRNVQGTALMKLYFHPETNMAQGYGGDDQLCESLSGIHAAWNRVAVCDAIRHRKRTCGLPSSIKRHSKHCRDPRLGAFFACVRCFSSLPGVSAPPPFGGSARSIVITVDPKKLQSYSMSPDEVITALTKGNTISPSGNVPIGDSYPIVPVNSVVKDPQQLGTIPVRMGENPVFIRDLGTIQDSADAPAGYALVNGRRAVISWLQSELKHRL